MSIFPDNFDVALVPPYYNDTHIAWRDSLRKLVETELAPHAETWDEQGDVPVDAHQCCAEIGLTGLGYPEEYGGLETGIDLFHYIIAAQELARLGAGGVATALNTHFIGLPPVLNGGTRALKERVAPEVIAGRKIICLAVTEPSGGSDVANLKTKAIRDGDDYIVSGSKTFISGGLKADYFTTAVRTGGKGINGISVLLLEKGMSGISATSLPKQGWWASDTATLYFDDVRVPAENLLGVENEGFKLLMRNFNKERLYLAAAAISYARVCLCEAVQWALERETFGAKLKDHQVIRHKIAEMIRKISASQAFLNECTYRLQQGENIHTEVALLKVQGSLTMEFCAREASQILGGASYIRGSKVERIYREVRVNAIGGGSEEIMRNLATQWLDKL